jgi:predicted ATP-binding protein involved in virulence
MGHERTWFSNIIYSAPPSINLIFSCHSPTYNRTRQFKLIDLVHISSYFDEKTYVTIFEG